MHARHLRERRRLNQMIPRGVLLLQREIAREQEKLRLHRDQARVLHVVVAFPHVQRFLQEELRVGVPVRVLLCAGCAWHDHPRLDHDEGAHHGCQAVHFRGGAALRGDEVLESLLVEDWGDGVHVFRVET